MGYIWDIYGLRISKIEICGKYAGYMGHIWALYSLLKLNMWKIYG